MTPSEKQLRIKAIRTCINWLRIRQENTVILVEGLGTASPERLEELLKDETFSALTNAVLDCVTKELNFLAEEKFPGLIARDISAEEAGLPPSGTTIN